jgi:hypothetical protein
VEEDKPKVQHKHRKKKRTGLRDKSFIDFIRDSNIPAAEMLLFYIMEVKETGAIIGKKRTKTSKHIITSFGY